MKCTLFTVSAMSAIAMAYGTASAHAQSADALAANAAQAQQDGSADVGVGDIVVTAQRRSESMQKVPISVTAISATKLIASGINSSQDIAVATPGLTMTTSRNTVTPYLRGVGTQSGNAGTEGSIATYIDGVYIASAGGAIFSLNNVERVEVLKGPQGTLFGRNATGGLIQVITRDPSHDPGFEASLGYGNYSTVTTSAYITGGLTDSVAADVSLYRTYQGEGWGKNIPDGKDVNLRNEWMVRSKVKADLGERTTIVLAGDYAWWRSDIGLTRQTLPGTVARGGYRPVGSIYDANASITLQPGDESNQWGGSLRIAHDLTDGITFTSTSAYRRFEVQGPLDNDTTPLVASDVTYREKTKTIQQEFLLNGSTGPLNWTAGAFYFHSESGFAPRIVFTTRPSAQNTAISSNIIANSFAGFIQGTYAVTDRTKLTAGLRYTTEKRHIEGIVVAQAGNTVPEGTILQNTDNLPNSITHGKDSKLTWRLALDHQINNDVLAYASYSRGFKAGGFNSSTLTVPPVEPETLDAYEVGLKTDLFDRMVRFNTSAFYYKYSNIQLQSVQAFTSSIFNAAKGTIKGIDTELTIVPPLESGRLELNGGVSYLHARYNSFPNAQITTPNSPTAGGNTLATGSASGNHMVRSPSITLNASASYSHPVGDTLKIGFDVNYLHTGKFYWEPDNRVSQSPVDLLNGQVWLGQQDDVWRVRFWAKNILKERYFASVNSSAFSDGASPAAPRTFGATLDLKFR